MSRRRNRQVGDGRRVSFGAMKRGTKTAKRTRGERPVMDATPPKKRRVWTWVRRVVLVVAAGVIGGHAWWGFSSERALERQVGIYAAAGERIHLADLAETPVADRENAVAALR